MNFPSLVLLGVCCSASSACAAALEPLAPTQLEARRVSDGHVEPPTRRPDAVVLEPQPAVPSAVERAEARGVVALREPLGGDAVRDVVLGLMGAWHRESLDELVALLASDAGPIESRARGRGVLVEGWRQRMHTHEYGRLASVDLVRSERIERYSFEDLTAPDAPARPPDMRPEELFVRVPIEVTHLGGERLFGDVMLLLLRREEGRYKIAAYGEADAN